MSNKPNTPPTIRWKLLSTVSAFALLASTYTANAAGNDSDRPLIWLELGGQAENVSGQGDIFVPAFLAANPDSSVIWNGVTPLQAQKPPKFSFGEEGRISYQPEGSDWIFSAAARIGRSNNFRQVHHQTYDVFHVYYKYGKPGPGDPTRGVDRFSNTRAGHRESHAILDFSAGKDVGLGLFGRDFSSSLNLGVRIAQFTSKANFDVRARPDLHFKYFSIPTYHISIHLPYYQTFHATGQAARSFRGIGPSLSWNGSAPFVGDSQDGELTIDWGINAALLFGKQKARVQHQASEHHVTPFFEFGGGIFAGYHTAPPSRVTDRSVTVPNVGGTIGLSWRVEDFNVSMGYRADFFFGAMDTGIDAAKKSNMAFKGPYASISVGLGD